MSIVAGIDPSLTSAGIAVLVNSAPILLRSVGYPGRNSDSYAERGNRIVAQARHIVEVAIYDGDRHPRRIDLAVIEGPAYEAKYGHAFDRAGLWWGLFTALRAKQIPTAVVPPATLKTWVTGKGNAGKSQITGAVKFWWPNARILNDDIADAAALALLGAYRLGDPMPFTIKDRHTNALDKIAWPQGTPA